MCSEIWGNQGLYPDIINDVHGVLSSCIFIQIHALLNMQLALRDINCNASPRVAVVQFRHQKNRSVFWKRVCWFKFNLSILQELCPKYLKTRIPLLKNQIRCLKTGIPLSKNQKNLLKTGMPLSKNWIRFLKTVIPLFKSQIRFSKTGSTFWKPECLFVKD